MKNKILLVKGSSDMPLSSPFWYKHLVPCDFLEESSSVFSKT